MKELFKPLTSDEISKINIEKALRELRAWAFCQINSGYHLKWIDILDISSEESLYLHFREIAPVLCLEKLNTKLGKLLLN